MTTARRLPPLCSIAAICALGGSALLMTGCSSTSTGSSVAEAAAASPTSTASPSPHQSLTQDQTQRRDLLSKTKVTWDQAAGTAVKEVSGGKLIAIELKGVSGKAKSSPTGTPSVATPNPAPAAGAPEWQTKVATADGTVHWVEVDAATGKVFRSQTEPDQDADDRKKIADRLRKATQTPAQVAKVATDKTKGKVTAVDLDEKDDKPVWSVDVVSTDNWTKTTYDIDAAKGTVVREHTDND
ncbi:PepSY domain-containing protein [Streptomyces sp. NPDC085995]|uniref:PepSY domain-containing protein n=1 Tax=Streptomyces sp. NPDC085995 TaxID=3154861 RepID=UPI00344018D6